LFELARYTGQPPRSISVQTAMGTPLKNHISPEPSHGDCLAFEQLCKNNSGWIVRKKSTGRYNCAGLVWANRRTCLSEPNEWELILHSPNGDGYRRLRENEPPEIGDVACYRKNDKNQEILHVARVCSKERLFTPSGIGGDVIVRALSKLDHRFGEVTHVVNHVGPLVGISDYRCEIWTDRS
jgi:hypothetical protein